MEQLVEVQVKEYNEARDAKDQYYALYALSQCLSSAAMWAEPYLCDSLLVTYGGHVVFDYSIPLGFIVYLAAASRMEPRKAKAA